LVFQKYEYYYAKNNNKYSSYRLNLPCEDKNYTASPLWETRTDKRIDIEAKST